MRPEEIFNPDKDKPSEEELSTIVQFLEMLILRREELLKVLEYLLILFYYLII